MARQSAKDRMRAEGVAKEKGEADMEEFIKDRDVKEYRVTHQVVHKPPVDIYMKVAFQYKD